MAPRLAWRRMRGSGRAGIARLLLLGLGTTFITAALLTANAVPQALQARHFRAEHRSIAISDSAPPLFRFAVAEDSLDDRPWTRVMISDVRSGAPAPPGLARLPRPGEVFVSPALARRLSDPAVAARLPGHVNATIGPAGLQGPDEQYSYVGVTNRQLGSAGDNAARFGAVQGPTGDPGGQLRLELAFLVGLPGVLFLLTVARLSAATRARRIAALRLVGMPSRQLRGISHWECAIPGMLGSLLGIGAFTMANRSLPRSELLGFTWLPSDTRTSLLEAFGIVLIVGLVASRTAAAGDRRLLRNAVAVRRGVGDSRPRWWTLLPVVIGSATLAAFLLTNHGRTVSRGGQATLVIAAALAAGGLIFGLRTLVWSSARLLARQTRTAAVRLGVRSAEHEPGSLIRVSAGLVALVLVAAVGTAVLRALTLADAPLGTSIGLAVDGSAVPSPAQRAAVTKLAGGGIGLTTTEPRQAAQAAATQQDAWRQYGFPVVFARCADLKHVAGVDARGCRDGYVYRMTDPLQPGLPVMPVGLSGSIRTGDGRTATVTAPQAVLVIPHLLTSPVSAPAVLITVQAPAGGWSSSAQFQFAVADGHGSLERFQTSLARISPTAVATPTSGDLAGRERDRIVGDSLRFGLGLGEVLAVLTFLAAAGDRALERRRAVAALRVVGASSRLLRTAQLVQLALTLGVGLLLATVLGSLSAAAYLAIDGSDRWYPAPLLTALALTAVGLLGGGTSAAIVFGRRLTAETLRRE